MLYWTSLALAHKLHATICYPLLDVHSHLHTHTHTLHAALLYRCFLDFVCACSVSHTLLHLHLGYFEECSQSCQLAVCHSAWACNTRSMWLLRERRSQTIHWFSCIQVPSWSCKRRPKNGAKATHRPPGNWPETLWDALAALAAVSATPVSSSKSRGSPIGGTFVYCENPAVCLVVCLWLSQSDACVVNVWQTWRVNL